MQAACRRFCKIYGVEIFFEDSIMEHPILLDVSQLLKNVIHCLQTLLKQMSAEGPQASRMSVDTGPFNFHYIIEGPVCYLTLTGNPQFSLAAADVFLYFHANTESFALLLSVS